MKPVYLSWSLALSLGGTLFSGYLSAYRLFAKGCAFNEPCALFLGRPACWFGFALFLLLFATSVLGFRGPLTATMTARANASTAFLGILFSGYITWMEAASWVAGDARDYRFWLPTCAYGLMFYLLIFMISIRYSRNRTAVA